MGRSHVNRRSSLAGAWRFGREFSRGSREDVEPSSSPSWRRHTGVASPVSSRVVRWSPVQLRWAYVGAPENLDVETVSGICGLP
jgi:hypothetical protein